MKATPDLEATFADNKYTVVGEGSILRHHALRIVSFEDRYFTFEQRVFCDRPTEKQLKVTVRTAAMHARV